MRARRRNAPERDVGAVVIAGGRAAGLARAPDRSWLTLAGRSLVSRTMEPIIRLPSLGQLVVLIEPDDRERLDVVMGRELPEVAIQVVTSTGTPAHSLHLALTALERDVAARRLKVVLVHDTAWPLASRHLVHEVVLAARRFDAAVPCLSKAPEIWLDARGVAMHVPLDRTDVLLQMPQAFSAAALLSFYRREQEATYPSGAPAEVYEKRSGRRVRAVAGESRNIRITAPEDIFAAESLLARSGFSSG